MDENYIDLDSLKETEYKLIKTKDINEAVRRLDSVLEDDFGLIDVRQLRRIRTLLGKSIEFTNESRLP